MIQQNALELVNQEVPLAPLRWNLCHAEGLTEANIRRIAESGIGVALRQGASADLAVLSDDVFPIDESEIAEITAELTICGGYVMHRPATFDLDVGRESPYPIHTGLTPDRSGVLP
jgi:predicted amidohydrolase YtcJ